MSTIIGYTKCTESWGAAEAVDIAIVKDASAKRVGDFPLEFLRRGSGNTSTVEYLLRVCRLVLDIPDSFNLVLSDRHGPLEPIALIEHGVYTINGTFPSRPGPSGKSRMKPFQDEDSASTVSNSSRSSMNQSHYKMELVQRDGECLLTGEDLVSSLVACHIVPFSLGQEKLDEICDPLTIGSFSVSTGLLLTPSLHRNFDRYLWSIYTFEGKYFVHVFGENYQELHGKQIQYRSKKVGRWPNAKLLQWHYAQCLMARFRGSMVRGAPLRPDTDSVIGTLATRQDLPSQP